MKAKFMVIFLASAFALIANDSSPSGSSNHDRSPNIKDYELPYRGFRVYKRPIKNIEVSQRNAHDVESDGALLGNSDSEKKEVRFNPQHIQWTLAQSLARVKNIQRFGARITERRIGDVYKDPLIPVSDSASVPHNDSLKELKLTMGQVFVNSTLMNMTKSSLEEVESHQEGVQALLAGLEKELNMVKSTVSALSEGYLMDLDRYVLFKESVNKVAKNLTLSKNHTETATLQTFLAKIIPDLQALDSCAIWWCGIQSNHTKPCLHFSFSAYVAEINNLTRVTEALLIEVLFSSVYEEKTQKDIETQYSRLKDVQSVDTTLWAKIAELEIVQQKVRDVSQMLINSETLLRHQKFWHEIDDKKTSDATLVIDKNGNGSYLANVGVFPSGVADLPSGIA